MPGCVDTYPLYKEVFPKLGKYSQERTVSVSVNEEYTAHNALNDVESLQNLCSVVDVENEQMCEFTCTADSAICRWKYTNNYIFLRGCLIEDIVSEWSVTTHL